MSRRCVIRRFESPDESRTFPKGRFELVKLGGLTIGRARYEPGWRWEEVDLRTGDLFFVPPGHDSWVVGNEPYVSLHLMGTEQYGKTKTG